MMTVQNKQWPLVLRRRKPRGAKNIAVSPRTTRYCQHSRFVNTPSTTTDANTSNTTGGNAAINISSNTTTSTVTNTTTVTNTLTALNTLNSVNTVNIATTKNGTTTRSQTRTNANEINTRKTVNVNNISLPNCQVILRDIFHKTISSRKCKVVLQDILHSAGIATEAPVMHNPHQRILRPTSDIVQIARNCRNDQKVTSCNSWACNTKEILNTNNQLFSSATHRTYNCIIPTDGDRITCSSTNVIYLITCKSCYLQYVGETVQPLNRRIGKHMLGIKHPEKHDGCPILTEHFTQGLCNGSHFTVQIIEKLNGDGRLNYRLDGKAEIKRKQVMNSEDPEVKKIRCRKEREWMLKLRTVYPYGLNEKIGNEDNLHDLKQTQQHTANKFPSLNRRKNNGRGHNRITNGITATTFISELQSSLTNNIRNSMNFLRYILTTMKKSELRKTADLIQDDILTVSLNDQYVQWYLASLDYIESKLNFQPLTPKVKRSPPSFRCKVDYINKGIELINLPRILHDDKLRDTFPLQKDKYEVPTVIYKLVDPIRNTIFNFNKFVKNLDVYAFMKNETTIPCVCNNSTFVNSDHQHIITGDLRIIKNNKLRKLFTKGPKFREPVTIDLQKAKNELLTSMAVIIDQWEGGKHGDDKVEFDQWKKLLEDLINERIKFLTTKMKFPNITPKLQQPRIKSALKELHKHFVITPIDKASGNVALICKRFYAQVIIKELGLNSPNIANPTYIRINDKTAEDVVTQQIGEMKKTFQIETIKDNKTLPKMYWIPKLHKTPIKPRFIIAGVRCTVKPLAKAVTEIFKKFYFQIEKYNHKAAFFSGVKTFWVIQNKDPVVKAMKSISTRKRATSISTFDFATLYTTIPHDKLIETMNEIVDFCFAGCSKSKIIVTPYSTYWQHDEKKNNAKESISFSKAEVKNAIKYLIENCFFSVGIYVFCQIIGIPMGTDPAPFMANFFLYYYENKYLRKLKKTDVRRARRFKNCFRFIDDLSILNDGGEFEKCHLEIYPPELELKKENINNTSASFLDLNINILNKTFELKLYDKRDSFPFIIVRMPYEESNMPSRIFYSSLGAEILRIVRCTTDKSAFINSANILCKRMIKQGAKYHRAVTILKKIYGKHSTAFQPFFNTSCQMIKELNIYNSEGFHK